MADVRIARPAERRPPRAHRRPGRLSHAIPAGLLLLVIGAALDLGAHCGVPLLSSARAADAGHLLTLAGMLLTLAGILRAGLQRRR